MTSIRVTIAAGLSDDQRYPTKRPIGKHEVEIGIAGAPQLAVGLKEKPYDEVYKSLLDAQAFNLKMVDGALIQMLYTFKRNKIASHRLAFFPCPNLHSYDVAPELYDDDQLFGDIVTERLVRFPLRFDFSSSLSEYVEIEHPMCHLTLGQYKNCRIPVSGPLTPTRFMAFLIRHFYYPSNSKAHFSKRASGLGFLASISEKEQMLTHVKV